jgi:alkylation response protein AidB-like acyl-CoA dehydrogenase
MKSMKKFDRLLNRNDLSPYLDVEQFEFRESVHRALEKHATADYLRACDEGKVFPTKLIDLAREQGWFAITLPEAYGGIGGYMDMISMLEVMGYHSTPLGRFWNVSVNMVGGALVRLGTEEQKKTLLPSLAEGKTFFAFALSENGSGSDAAAMKTNAVLDGDDFVINGTKMWITGVLEADYILMAMRTDKSAEGKHEGISLVLVPKNAPGVTIRPIDFLGGGMMRSCEINLVDVRVPKVNMVGDLHRGWLQLLGVLGKERIALSAICTGGAQAALDQALEYARERKQFGRPISSFQAISHKLAEMQTLIDASRLMAFRGARLLQEDKPCAMESAQAKFFATDSYMRIATDSLQIMGANGYTMENAMQRHFREAKMFQILGGTSEIHRNNVAREMLRA